MNMNFLLDTHVLIWWVEGSSKIGRRAKKALLHPEATVWVSAANIWEISIKAALGRLDPFDPPEDWTLTLVNELGVRSLPITFEHAAAVRHLPLHHGDPFDRMLIAQARCESLTLLTVDPLMEAYDVRLLDASE
jgi:PIN domain nuclease of toxin-antitoxin system